MIMENLPDAFWFVILGGGMACIGFAAGAMSVLFAMFQKGQDKQDER